MSEKHVLPDGESAAIISFICLCELMFFFHVIVDEETNTLSKHDCPQCFPFIWKCFLFFISVISYLIPQR